MSVATRSLRSLVSGRCWQSSCSPVVLRRHYHTPSSPPPSPFSSTESALLSAAMVHVPQHGFTDAALARGAQDAGYLAASTSILPRGPFELVYWHLVTQRLALSKNVQFAEMGEIPDGKKPMGRGAKVRSLVLARLKANENVIQHWQDALALSTRPSNASTMVIELALLSDEIWHLAGDTAVDFSWYTRRGTLAALYGSAELFQTTDTSPHFSDTEAFVDRRLEEIREFGSFLGATGDWAAFSVKSAINVARSKGMPL